jgi:outer membrane biosynthesis protein TonB
VGSPAIDGGDTVTCPPADQRGISRPQGAACDIGAFELGPAATDTPTPTPAPTDTPTPTPALTDTPTPTPAPTPTSTPTPTPSPAPTPTAPSSGDVVPPPMAPTSTPVTAPSGLPPTGGSPGGTSPTRDVAVAMLVTMGLLVTGALVASSSRRM